MKRFAVVLMSCVALAACSDSAEQSGESPIDDIVARLEVETDSVVRAAMARNGVQSFDPPEPGLSDTYLRAPRRHAQVKRFYDGWARVDAALSPTIYQTMADIAERLEDEADLSPVDSMNLPVFVQSAIRNRRREIELRGQLADMAITLYEQDEVASRTTLAPSFAAPRRGSTDSISLERRRMTAEQRRVISEGEARTATGSLGAQRMGAEVQSDIAERTVTQYRGRIDGINAEIQELLARRAAGHQP